MTKYSISILIAGFVSLISCTTPDINKNTANESNNDSNTAVQQEPTSGVVEKSDSIKTNLSQAPSLHLLTGDWVRSDGGYMISIRGTEADGTLKAEYFNPKPIKVGKARWEMEDDSLYVQVELQDINYPGSIYTLQYIAGADKLNGIYFQAVEGATYEVVFNRKK